MNGEANENSTIELLEAILCSTPAIVVYVDNDLNIVRVNRAFAESDKQDPAELIGKPFFQLYPNPANEKIFRQVLTTGEPYFEFARPHFNPRHPERGITFWDGGVSPVKDSSGRITGALLTSFNVTGRKKAEDALQHERERARKCLDIADVFIIAIGLDEKVQLINKKGLQILGCSEEEVLGKNWFDNFLPVEERDRIRRVFHRIIGGEMPALEHGENLILDKQGRKRMIFWRNSLLFDEHDKISGTLSSGDDVTERRKAEEDLQRTERLESLGILAGGIAHDFNNLLVGLFGFLGLARESIEPGSAAAGYLDKALSAYEKTRALTMQLLTFARGGEPLKEPVDLAPLLRETLHFVLSGSNITTTLDIAPDLCWSNVDPRQIEQVIDNIAINARQAMPHGGTLLVEAANCPRPPSVMNHAGHRKFVKISISDNGVGIAPENLSRIFDPFFTTKQGGSGLGLTTAYSIIRRHGGHLEVKSAPEQGTTFIIYLPACNALGESVPDKPPALAQGKGKILVMDDEESICELADIVLSGLGYQVTCAKNGEQAVDLYKNALTDRKPFDFTILDLTVVGGLGGLEAAAQIKEFDSSAKLVASSGYSNAPVMAAPQSYGFICSLPKPYRKTDLAALIQEIAAANKATNQD
ncbi:MAG TPA: PAS domain S-box protein [Oligoflexia bacterium]|nr:PAS domain S-box protein [Oligoflexia bacterium]